MLPGVLDGHAHTALPPEDSASGTKAATKGGVTTILEMPGTQMGCFYAGEFREKRDLYEATSHVDFSIHTGYAAEFPQGTLTEMWGMGATGVKFFVSSAGLRGPQTFDGFIIDRFREIAGFNGLALIHAENDQILRDNLERLKDFGRRDYGVHLKWRPPIAEAKCGRRMILYLKETGCRGLIIYTSLPETVLNAGRARLEGTKVHVETYPQYLYSRRTTSGRKDHGPSSSHPPQE